MSRIAARFAALRAEGRAGLVTYLTAGDPDPDTSARLFADLAAAGADLIEIGMPFSDPMADGPAIQEAGQRALKQGMTLRGTLALVRELRRADEKTPIVLMGYYNPIYRYGSEAFAHDAARTGVDGVIIVDLPPEEDVELTFPAHAAGLDVIRLATPTSDEKRLPLIVEHAGGFIYYVAIAGITEQNVDEVLASGIKAIAVTAAVAGSDNPRGAAERLKQKLKGTADGRR